MSGTGGLVGRDRELDQVTGLLLDERCSVVLAGPEGSGRSRFAAACLDRAVSRGWRARRVLATRGASSIPLGAFLGVFEVGLLDGPRPLERARAALVGGAGDPPGLLLVDDAHLLDDVSATLLLSLAADPAVTLLVTVRAGSPQPDAVTAIWKDAGARRVDLTLLDRDGTTELLADRLGGPVAPGTVETFAALAGGAPLALCEAADAALASGQLRRDGGVWHLDGEPVVPARLAELIAARLDALGADATRLITALGLAEPLTLAIVDDLGLGGALALLEAQGVVEVGGLAAGGVVRLHRAVYGQIAVDRASGEERRALYAACSAATDQWAAHWPDRFRAVLWRLWSGQAVGAADLLEAARQAYVLADYDRTRELARAAWAAERSVAVGHLLGFALGRAGRCEEAEEVLAATASLVDTDRDEVLVALARSENLHRGLDDVDRALAVCREAEARVTDPAWRDELVAHRAMTHLHQGRVVATLDLAEPLVTVEPAVAPRAFVKAAYPVEIARIHAGRIDDGIALARVALPLHEQVWEDDLFQTESGVHHLATLLGLTSSGRLDAATTMGELALAFTRDANPRYGFAHISNLVGWNELHRGRVATARRHFRDAIGIFVDGRQFSMARWCLAGTATCSVHLGDLDAAREAFVEVDRLDSPAHQLNRALVEDARAWLIHAGGEPGRARAHLAAETQAALDAGDRVGAARLLHTLARCGGAADAADGLEALAASVDGDLVRRQADVARALAADDPAALVEVATAFADLGARLYAAEARAAAARALARRGRRRDAARAERLRAELLDACEGATSPLTWSTGTGAALSPREREVADLAAQRLASKEISERLGVSPRTVDNHLQRIYQKLGASGRADLLAILAERGDRLGPAGDRG